MREFVASRHKLKELPKEVQRLKKNYTNWKLISSGRMKNIENGKYKLIINDFSFPFLKCIWLLKVKIITLSYGVCNLNEYNTYVHENIK